MGYDPTQVYFLSAVIKGLTQLWTKYFLTQKDKKNGLFEEFS